MNETIIGVNIEDNHLSVGLVNMETRKVVSGTVQRKRVDPMGSAEYLIATWSKVIKEVAGQCTKIGIGLPGECDYQTGIYLHNDTSRYYSLNGANLKDIFSNALGCGPENVKMMNDAACFLQGEVFGGSGRGFKSSLGVTLGMGLGTAVYSNNVVVDANLHSMPFLASTAEENISIRWLLKRFKELNGVEAIDLADVRQQADSNPVVGQLFEEFAINIARFLEIFIRKNSPEVIVIGGFMELYNRFFFDSVVAKMAAMGIKAPILRAILGEQASIIGAASTWYSESPLHS